MTRAQVQKRLGLTRSKLENLERTGALRVARDFYGRRKFDPALVEAIRGRSEPARAPRRPSGRGAVDAKIFKLFGDGLALREVVIQTEQSAEYVEALRRKYAEMGRDFLLTPRGTQELRELLDWRGDDEGSLLAALTIKLRRQFERGVAFGRDSEGEKHNRKAESSGKHTDGDGRAETESGDDAAAGKGTLGSDPRV